MPIISEPCMPTIVRYWLAPKTCVVGDSSSVRISIALRPPMKKKIPMPIMYCIEMIL